jgi:hypothetical protein
MSKSKAGLISIICLLLSCLLAAGCISSGFDSKLNEIVKPYRFSIIGWEIEAISHELEEWIFGDSSGTADESPVVLEYFNLAQQIAYLERQIEVVRDGIEPGDMTILEDQLESSREQKDALESKAEKIMEKQIRETLGQLGIFNPADSYLGIKIGFPPVNFELETPPHLLVVSPRDSI